MKTAGWLLVAALVLGCDDGSSDDAAADAGSQGGDDAGAAVPQEGVYTFTTLGIEEPAGLATVGNLLSQSIQMGEIFLFLELAGWGTADMVVRGGAGEQTEGAGTADDFDDDAFCWLTEGQCRDGDGNLTPCAVEVGETGANVDAPTADGEPFTGVQGGNLDLYAASVNTVIRFKDVAIDGVVKDEGGSLEGVLRGKMLVTDAENTYIQIQPNTPILVFKAVLDSSGVMPEVEVDGEPAYQFRATFGAVKSRFACP